MQIIVNLCGRLGNQLFEYATGKVVSLITGAALVLNISSENAINTNENSIFQLNIVEAQQKFSTEGRYSFSEKIRIKEKNYKDVKKILKHSTEKRVLIDSYFQNERYFKKYKTQIKKMFVPKTKLSSRYYNYLYEVKKVNSVSIHIRRGDYLQFNNIYVNLSKPYYTRAIRYINKKIKTPVFYVFSDDIEWCKQHQKEILPSKYKYVFVDQLNAIEALFLMSKCKHNITANSTFSWWAAWLNDYRKKIVITPLTWFHKKPKALNYDIPPNSWVKLKST